MSNQIILIIFTMERQIKILHDLILSLQYARRLNIKMFHKDFHSENIISYNADHGVCG